MAKKVILGSDIARDTLKAKVNDNFTELYDKDVTLEASINSLVALEAWQSAVLQNGWTADSGIGIKYFKHHGIVYLNIRLIAGTITGGIQISGMPVGYRPASNLVIPLINTATGVLGYIVINANGAISLLNAGTFAVGGLYVEVVAFRGDN